MGFHRKRNGHQLPACFFVGLIICSIAFVFCSKAKKEESPAVINSHDVSPEGLSLQESQESAEPPAVQVSEINASSVELAAKKLENTFAALEDTIQRIPRETFDPEAVLHEAGSDPVKLFEWVRDRTFLIPYQGSLRGPSGLLMDRRGNSLDRALLLCELLRLAGHEARLARRRLSEEEAATILKRAASRPPGEGLSLQQPTLRDKEDRIAFYVQNHELDRQHIIDTITKSEQKLENTARQIKSEHKELVTDIFSILNKSLKQGRGGESTRTDDLRDHWWVQWAKADEWANLDPALPDATPGKIFGEPEETLDPESLEESLFHTIRIQAVAEQFEEGRVQEKIVLQHTLVPSKTLGQRIVLRHLPLNWPSDENFLSASKPVPFLQEAITKQAEWQAVLEIDGEAVESSYLTAQGAIGAEPSQKPGRKKGMTGGVGGLFGGLAGKEEEEEGKGKEEKPTGKAHLTAEWLEFEIYTPGRPAQVYRREIFDLVGPAARKGMGLAAWKPTEQGRINRAYKILSETEILPLVCELSPEFIEERTASYVLLNRDAYLSLVENYGRSEPQELFAEMTKIKPLSGKLYGLALKRFRLSPHGGGISLCGPNLMARHSGLRTNEQAELILTECLDIIANDVRPTRKTSDQAFSARVEQGILDTLVEAHEMAEQGTVENAAFLFRQSKAAGINWLLIQGPEDPNWKRLQVSADVRTRLEHELSRGFAVIAPEKEISTSGRSMFAWWRLHPETGHFLGLGEKGSGQAMTEYAEKVDIVLQLKSMIEYYANLGRCLGIGITAPLRGNRPQHDELVIECIWSTICTNASGVAAAFMDIEVNWTNIIINETLNWAMGSLCEALWEKGIKK